MRYHRYYIWDEGFLKIGESYADNFASLGEDGNFIFDLEKLAGSRQHRTNLANVYFVLVKLGRLTRIEDLPIEKKLEIWTETIRYCGELNLLERKKFSYSIYALRYMLDKKAARFSVRQKTV